MKVGSRRRRAALTTAALLGAGALIVPATAATGGPRVAIATVNGQDASSGTLRNPLRTDTLTATGTARTNAALLADAGASSAVATGTAAPLTGIASFGTAPYAFAWSYQGASGRFSKPTAASTTFDTTGITGPATVDLKVTDANGDTATDTVKVVALGMTDAVLLDETRAIGPGVPDEFFEGSPTAHHRGDEEFAFAVPSGSTTLDVSMGFGGGATGQNDIDLYVDDPTDREDANRTGASSANPEVVHVDAPATGDWKAVAAAYLNTDDTLHVVATAHTLEADPTPQLDAGGPYQFVEGADQQLAAKVTGGTGPYNVGWDLNGDNLFEVQGADVLAGFPIGTHLVTVKVTDGAGYEKRETLGVRVLAPGAPTPDPGLVVVAVADSGINLYHEDFRATTFPDARTLALTNNFTRHPSEYIPGYPKDAEALNLTLGEDYYPAADHATLAGVVENKLYWVPGTKIVGAMDTGSATFTNSTAPDDIHLLDENGHGTGSASVAVGNIYGFCPTCLLVDLEATSNQAWEYATPWIDLASNSFGPASNVGFAGLASPTFPKTSAERGQIALYAAGNGNENAFVTPEQTYASEHLGPGWSIRVGAVTTGTRRPIIGTGKPVDIASFGSGDIPAADPLSVHGLGSHSGTSAATPYSAGVFGTVLAAAREALGDTGVGQRWGSDGVIARGTPQPGSPYLYDGVLTRNELMEIVFKTAAQTTVNDGNFDIFPPTTPPNDKQFLLEGRGIVDPASGARAREVLLGHNPLPVRPQDEEDFFVQDASIRANLWGEWTGGGHNSAHDPGAPVAQGSNPIAGLTLGAAVTSPASGAVLDPTVDPIRALAGVAAFPTKLDLPATPAKLYLHRTGGTTCADGAYTLDRVNSAGDRESGCQFQPAQPAFEKAGLGFLEPYKLVDAELPAVLTTKAPVAGTIFVRTISPSPAHTLHLTLRSGGAVVGETRVTKQVLTANAAAAAPPTAFDFSIPVPPAFAGRAIADLALEIVHEQSTSVGTTVLEGASPSFVNLPLVAAADRPANQVEVSVDDPGFADPIVPALDATQTSFADHLDVLSLADGKHYVYARARQGNAVGPVRMNTITVRRTTPIGKPVVQVQLTRYNGPLRSDGWANVTDTSGHGDYATWTSTLSIRSLPTGFYTLHSRVLDAKGAAVATASVSFLRQRAR
jgi:hypothetical protein